MPQDPLIRFKEIVAEYRGAATSPARQTEADTRANLLDRLIHEVLRWPRNAVKREPFANPGFIDYQFIHGRPILLLEAKADGSAFELPHSKHPQRRMALDGALMSNKAIRDAVLQVQRYAVDTATRFAVATNGDAFIVFRALNESRSWRDAQAIVYHDVDDVIADFTAFYNTLSYEAVVDGALDDHFRLAAVPNRSYYRPLDELVDADAAYDRNALTSILAPYIDHFFGDIAVQQQTDILEHCYVKSRPIQIIDDNLKIAINDEIPRFAAAAQDIQLRSTSDHGNFGRDLSSLIDSRSDLGSVFIIMGGIGAGKSTFCRRFFRVVAPELANHQGPAFLAYLDFLGASDDPILTENLLWSKLSVAIRRADPKLTQRPTADLVFADEIATVRQMFGNRDKRIEEKVSTLLHEHIRDDKLFAEAALKYLVSKTKVPIAVFDNVDQLAFPAQVQLFTIAQRLSNFEKVISLIVLREESYSTALMRKHLTAYAIRPYHLASPSFYDLITLRIDFAINQATNKGANNPAHLQVAGIFEVVRDALLANNRNILRAVEALAYGNMRVALQIFNAFITSGATDLEKILSFFDSRGLNVYTVPFHEFAKSIMLGDYRYYRQGRSLLLNLFDCTKHPNASHFTSLRLLRYLAAVGGRSSSSEDFVRLQAIITDLSDLFGNEEDIKATILKLVALNRQLLELDTRRPDSLEGATGIRITASGSYYLNYLANSFSYLDLAWQDTPFNDRGVADKLTRVISKTELEDRFWRVETFLGYLDKEEKHELNERGLVSNIPTFCGPFLERIQRFYLNEKAVIKKKKPKARGR